MASIEQQLTSIQQEAAKNLNLKNFSFNQNLRIQKGDGFLGQLYKLSILDSETNTKIDLAIKKAPTEEKRRDETCVENAYKNEIFFYKTLMPTLKRFQQECGIFDIFDPVPTYVASVSEVDAEMIVFEDLTSHGYQMREKDLVLDKEHVRFIFETYGRFHALSFCLKDQKPDEFRILTKSCHNIFKEFTRKKGFSLSLSKIAERCLKAFDQNRDGQVIEKFKIYADKTMDIFADSLKYKGEYSGILHGDCWSNNMMFKYQNSQNKSKLEAIKLLDFQMIFVGSPVYDLSYFFYSGGSKELFDNLEHYLDVYYRSFSNFAQNLGSVPKKLLPREVLTEDWKKYSKFGMLMSILLTKVKLMTKEASIELAESINEEKNNESGLVNATVNEELFNERVRDILVHMCEINAL